MREAVLSKEEKYQNWFPQKQKLDRAEDIPFFKEGEVWWCPIGVNIGYENFGKGKRFTRPVLVLRKHSRHMFLGAALSTAAPKTPLHVPIFVAGKKSVVRLDQLRTYDARRMTQRPIKRLGTKELNSVIQVLMGMMLPKN